VPDGLVPPSPQEKLHNRRTALESIPKWHKMDSLRRYSMRRLLLLVGYLAFLCASLHAQQSEQLLDGSAWKMGSYDFGAGEIAGAWKPDFDDSTFKRVTVPGDTQLQAGFTDMGRFRQTAALLQVNRKE